MIKHYITKYYEGENGEEKRYAEAWIQINIFGLAFCISKRKISI